MSTSTIGRGWFVTQSLTHPNIFLRTPRWSADEMVTELRRQLRIAQANNEQRNRELDALHYVWCDGGCGGGVHRWVDESNDPEFLRSLAETAQRQVDRLRRKAGALEYRRGGTGEET